MSHDDLLQRISINPEICFGKPCIRGHRIWVSLVLDFLASGSSLEDILEDYPQLEREDVLACIAYGADMTAARRGASGPGPLRQGPSAPENRPGRSAHLR